MTHIWSEDQPAHSTQVSATAARQIFNINGQLSDTCITGALKCARHARHCNRIEHGSCREPVAIRGSRASCEWRRRMSSEGRQGPPTAGLRPLLLEHRYERNKRFVRKRISMGSAHEAYAGGRRRDTASPSLRRAPEGVRPGKKIGLQC